MVLSLFVGPHQSSTGSSATACNLAAIARILPESASLDLLKKNPETEVRRWKTAGVMDNTGKSKLIICLVFPSCVKALINPSRVRYGCSSLGQIFWKSAPLSASSPSKTVNGFSGLILGNAPIETEATRQILVLPMRPTFTLDRTSAAILNGTPDTRKLVAVGLGALGSHVFDNLLKSGFGSWTLVDNDTLLPHNCARHVLDGSGIIRPKADAMRDRANNIIQDIPVASIVADVLNPGDKADALKKVLNDADVILDMSASVAVSRHLALDCPALARRACLFLNPSGDTLVVLIEDSSRTIPLDWLELHYFRALNADTAFANHFESPGNFRYSRSCGDISSRISQDLVSLHSAIASRALRTGLRSEQSTAVMYCAQSDLSTKSHPIPVDPPLTEAVKGWTILSNPGVIAEAHHLRKTKLPNETGGVLLGAVDSNHRRIYVIDLVPSPSDSQEWPKPLHSRCGGLAKSYPGDLGRNPRQRELRG